MPGPVRVGTIIDVTWGSMTRGREIAREAERLFSGATQAGIEQGAAQAVRTGDAYREMSKRMREAGLEGVKEVRDALIAHKKEEMKYEKAAAQFRLKAAQAATDAEKDHYRKLMNQAKRKAQAEQRLSSALSKKMTAEAEARIALFEEAENRMSRTSAQKNKELADSFSSAIEGALDPSNLDLKDLTSGIGGALSKGLKGAAGKAQMAGMDPKLVAGLAAAAGPVAAVAVTLAALVGVFAAAAGQATAMNKKFMESASAVDVLGTKMGKSVNLAGAEYSQLNVELKRLRTTALDTAFDFRVSKDEVMDAIGAINEAGLTVRDFSKFVGEGTHPLKAYKDVAEAAVIAARGLGISASEVGEFMKTTFKDLGYDLSDVQGAFGTIAGAAVRAGMTTKDFFSSINQASQGMALMSFRIQDTIGLFEDMVKILGEDLAKSQLALEGTFRGMGMKERVKTTMLTGPTAGKIAAADARAQGKAFAEQFGDIAEFVGIGDLSSDEGLKNLGGMSGEEFRKVYADVAKRDPVAARQLQTLQELSKAAAGGTMNVAASLGSLSKQGELAMQLSTGAALTGGRALSELGPRAVMMIQESLGIGAEQFEVLKRLDTGLRAEFQQMQRNQDLAVQGKTFAEAVADGTLSQSEEMKEAAAEQYSLMEQTAMDQLRETTSIKDTLMNKIAQILESIYLTMEHVATLIGFIPGVGGKAISAKAEDLSAARDEAKIVSDAVRDQYDEQKKKLREMEEKAKGGDKEAAAGLENQKAIVQEFERKSKGAAAYQKYLVENMKAGMTSKELKDVKGEAKIAAAKTIQDTADPNLNFKLGEGGARSFEEMKGKSLPELLEGEEAQVRTAELAEQQLAQEKKDQEINKKITEGGFEDVVKTLKRLSTEEAQRQLAMVFGQDAVTDALKGPKGLNKLIEKVKEDGLTEAEYMLLAKAGFDVKSYQGEVQAGVGGVGSPGESKGESPTGVSVGPTKVQNPFDDFIYQGNSRGGVIRPIDSADEFLGMKPGGAVMEALQRGGGGGKSVVVNINGGDEGRVYNVLKRVLSETGYGNLKSY